MVRNTGTHHHPITLHKLNIEYLHIAFSFIERITMDSIKATDSNKFFNNDASTEVDGKNFNQGQGNFTFLGEKNHDREEGFPKQRKGNTFKDNIKESVLDPFGCWEFIV